MQWPPLPLRCTGRAWRVRRRRALQGLNPPRLHPTIPVHAPLVFDIVDKWSNRSVVALTTLRILPGAITETLPVNAYEAESRRLWHVSGLSVIAPVWCMYRMRPPHANIHSRWI